MESSIDTEKLWDWICQTRLACEFMCDGDDEFFCGKLSVLKSLEFAIENGKFDKNEEE